MKVPFLLYNQLTFAISDKLRRPIAWRCGHLIRSLSLSLCLIINVLILYTWKCWVNMGFPHFRAKIIPVAFVFIFTIKIFVIKIFHIKCLGLIILIHMILEIFPTYFLYGLALVNNLTIFNFELRLHYNGFCLIVVYMAAFLYFLL